MQIDRRDRMDQKDIGMKAKVMFYTTLGVRFAEISEFPHMAVEHAVHARLPAWSHTAEAAIGNESRPGWLASEECLMYALEIYTSNQDNCLNPQCELPQFPAFLITSR